jgi:hypothetical protein
VGETLATQDRTICGEAVVPLLRVPIDKVPENASTFVSHLRKYFFECSWHEVYDFLKFVVGERDDLDRLQTFLNVILER